MSRELTIASLFDGIGGFPLAGSMVGFKPIWCSEIEDFPNKVTETRFPNMKHYGDITKINGCEVENVDIVTFGSPCQDLSIAGKRKSFKDENGELTRSGLFYEAIRVIKEMRENDRTVRGTDVHIRPRFAVWENVPGAFSSNKGQDFRCVLEELARVKDPQVSIPMPKDKWRQSGSVVGEGWSIAWRTLDAQYWGVPQRRRRIFLVADFDGECAREILFKSEGLSRHFEEIRETWQTPSIDTQGCIDAWSR